MGNKFYDLGVISLSPLFTVPQYSLWMLLDAACEARARRLSDESRGQELSWAAA